MTPPRKPGRPRFSVGRFSGDHDKESLKALRLLCEVLKMRPVEVQRKALTRWAKKVTRKA